MRFASAIESASVMTPAGRNLDGETSRLEIGGQDRLPGTTAKLELELPGCGELHDVLLQFSSDRGDRTATITCPPEVASTR